MFQLSSKKKPHKNSQKQKNQQKETFSEYSSDDSQSFSDIDIESDSVIISTKHIKDDIENNKYNQPNAQSRNNTLPSSFQPTSNKTLENASHYTPHSFKIKNIDTEYITQLPRQDTLQPTPGNPSQKPNLNHQYTESRYSAEGNGLLFSPKLQNTNTITSRDSKAEQVVQNLYTKLSQIILQSRAFVDYEEVSESCSTVGDSLHSLKNTWGSSRSTEIGPKRINKWFNIETIDWKSINLELSFWRKAVLMTTPPPPLYIIIYLDISQVHSDKDIFLYNSGKNKKITKIDITETHAIPNKNFEKNSKDFKNNSIHKYNNNSSENYSYRNSQYLETKNDSDSSSYATKKERIILETWKVQLSHPLPYPPPELPNVYKKSLVFFRSLYALVQLLPVSTLFRKLEVNPSSDVNIGWRVSQDTTKQPKDIEMLDLASKRITTLGSHTFQPLVTPLGSLDVKVDYLKESDFRAELKDNMSSIISNQELIEIDDAFFTPTLASHITKNSLPQSMPINMGKNNFPNSKNDSQNSKNPFAHTGSSIEDSLERRGSYKQKIFNTAFENTHKRRWSSKNNSVSGSDYTNQPISSPGKHSESENPENIHNNSSSIKSPVVVGSFRRISTFDNDYRQGDIFSAVTSFNKRTSLMEQGGASIRDSNYLSLGSISSINSSHGIGFGTGTMNEPTNSSRDKPDTSSNLKTVSSTDYGLPSNLGYSGTENALPITNNINNTSRLSFNHRLSISSGKGSSSYGQPSLLLVSPFKSSNPAISDNKSEYGDQPAESDVYQSNISKAINGISNQNQSPRLTSSSLQKAGQSGSFEQNSSSPNIFSSSFGTTGGSIERRIFSSMRGKKNRPVSAWIPSQSRENGDHIAESSSYDQPNYDSSSSVRTNESKLVSSFKNRRSDRWSVGESTTKYSYEHQQISKNPILESPLQTYKDRSMTFGSVESSSKPKNSDSIHNNLKEMVTDNTNIHNISTLESIEKKTINISPSVKPNNTESSSIGKLRSSPTSMSFDTDDISNFIKLLDTRLPTPAFSKGKLSNNKENKSAAQNTLKNTSFQNQTSNLSILLRETGENTMDTSTKGSIVAGTDSSTNIYPDENSDNLYSSPTHSNPSSYSNSSFSIGKLADSKLKIVQRNSSLSRYSGIMDSSTNSSRNSIQVSSNDNLDRTIESISGSITNNQKNSIVRRTDTRNRDSKDTDSLLRKQSIGNNKNQPDSVQNTSLNNLKPDTSFVSEPSKNDTGTNNKEIYIPTSSYSQSNKDETYSPEDNKFYGAKSYAFSGNSIIPESSRINSDGIMEEKKRNYLFQLSRSLKNKRSGNAQLHSYMERNNYYNIFDKESVEKTSNINPNKSNPSSINSKETKMTLGKEPYHVADRESEEKMDKDNAEIMSNNSSSDKNMESRRNYSSSYEPTRKVFSFINDGKSSTSFQNRMDYQKVKKDKTRSDKIGEAEDLGKKTKGGESVSGGEGLLVFNFSHSSLYKKE
ncbi:hypothetical protein BB559_005486 [Furculomyces boomerangus]|uniref:Autophagy-related protein 13 n=1 Tax=Furculomyces boomerangus TaxID=61424 RepID=A0A2T9Y8H8_9FUNG|nr:hypothetical protein BB559_005486 [Furculomyces boomerangus]